MKLKYLALLVILPIIAISLGIAVYGYSEAKIRTDYSNQHATASNPIVKICGDHTCKPGEVFKP